MAIRDELANVLTGYVHARQTQRFPGDFKIVFDRLSEGVRALPAVKAQPELKVRAGFGMGQWSRSPWVCLMDPLASASPQGGVFLNIKFRQDMSGVYLSLNQGHNRDNWAPGWPPPIQQVT